VCDVRRRLCSSIVREGWSEGCSEGCREAELHGGCGMLAVEAMEGAWLLLSLAVRCSARAAHAACQPRATALGWLLPRAYRPVLERPIHHTFRRATAL
jgi:hypothetical protein